MNHKKISFIYCTNDDEQYAESVKYLQSLYVPEGFEVDIIAVTDANSITEGYNSAMLQSDAKYKVYLHQDVFIVNKDFMSDIVNLFTQHPSLGLLGVAGSKTLPLNGNWRKSSKTYGKILENRRTGKMESFTYGVVSGSYERVQAVDGLILITQYDVEWREDLLVDRDLCGASQSLEFQRAGYDVGVAEQIEPWCVNDCGIVQKSAYDQQQKVFLNEYENELWPYNRGADHKVKYPLVSVLIPAYNQPDLLRDALESVLDQTYPDIEIIIGDDSTNDKVEQFIQPYLDQYKQITYFKNEKTSPDFGYQNMVNCLKISNGEYVNFLNHDDLFHSEKIERMMRSFMENPDVKLVTSARQPFKDGTLLPMEGSFTKLFDKDTLINGHELSRIVISNLRNLIGEPSIVLFERKYIDANQFNYFNGVRHLYVGDLANWFTLLQHGDAVYIADPLSYVRIHSDQNTMNLKVVGNSLSGWYNIIKQSYAKGIIHNLNEYKKTLNVWINKYTPIPDYFINDADIQQREQLSNCFKEAVDIILMDTIEEQFECPVCNQNLERFLPYNYKKHKNDYTVRFQIIGSDLNNFRCPKCYSHDRTRHLKLYFDRLNMWEECIVNKKILHIAPESHLRQKISEISTEEYVCGDLYPSDNTIHKIDITDITFGDNHFDFIICNHVLEHVPDDSKAMNEFYRVLKKGGKAVLQTPYSPLINESFEDDTLVNEQQKKYYFGQKDHVRVYGLDLFERLESAGFILRVVKNSDLFSDDDCEKYGVNPRENLIMVEK